MHKQFSGDTSYRAYFFTREQGLIPCLCKGGRSTKKQSLLQVFTPLWVRIEERYGRFYASSIENTEPAPMLGGEALISGLYLNELLYQTLKPASPEADLFDAYWVTLQALSQVQDRAGIESLLRRFEWTLLQASGYGFSLVNEAEDKAPIQAHAYYRFVAGEGFIRQEIGLPGADILALAEDNLDEDRCRKTAKLIMRMAIDHLLGGKEIKTRSLYSLRRPA